MDYGGICKTVVCVEKFASEKSFRDFRHLQKDRLFQHPLTVNIDNCQWLRRALEKLPHRCCGC